MIHEGNGNYSSEHHGWNNLILAYERDEIGAAHTHHLRALQFALQTRVKYEKVGKKVS